MVTSRVESVDEYLASLPDDRREAIATVRQVILSNLPEGFEEVMQYGMISYVVPLARHPDTYNGQPLAAAALASQKQYMSVYLMSVYADDGLRASFEDAYRKTGKKLNMGKSCVRFRSLEQLPLELVGEAIARVGVDEFIDTYEAARRRAASTRKK